MFKIGDLVFVQTKGVCVLENIAKNAFDGADSSKEYYVLKPVDSPNNMMVYFPTDTKVNIRALTSKTKVANILKNFASLDDVEIDAEENRFEVYNQISKKGNLEEWAKLLKTLLLRKSKSNKKQLNVQEQKLINAMLFCVTSEMSYALSKDKNEIENLILSSIENM